MTLENGRDGAFLDPKGDDVFGEAAGEFDFALHPVRRVGRGGEDDDQGVGVGDALFNPRPELLIGMDGTDVVEHVVVACGAEERFHLRDVAVIGGAVGNEGAAHGWVVVWTANVGSRAARAKRQVRRRGERG